MSERFPAYDVLAKRRTPSWNETTRRVIDQRLAIPREPRFFAEDEFQTLDAICARIIPQGRARPPVPLAAMVDAKLFNRIEDGYRDHRIPPAGVAWKCALHAINEEARRLKSAPFSALDTVDQDEMLQRCQNGTLTSASWKGMDCALLFMKRLLPDIVSAYYSHPTAWSEIGFGGPASPRGYVRMDFDRRDPWEAAEAKPGRERQAAKENVRVG